MAPAESVAHFDSALSSLVSSPQGGGDEMAAIGDLIGRLGSICNHGSASANNSCYSTPRTRARSCPRVAGAGDDSDSAAAAEDKLEPATKTTSM
ncbi:hypothetical protein OsJ_20386 [Oryza sativa Japonica Group]|uniref:Uncharacterized protein n=1 Tax=Oryza sativa subsp. japonica TaxID=39947 RepID=B9FRW8_ORYSJ|nr:hypothetical protein OsJ_20386 [Oryza sativa Japonica Group]